MRLSANAVCAALFLSAAVCYMHEESSYDLRETFGEAFGTSDASEVTDLPGELEPKLRSDSKDVVLQGLARIHLDEKPLLLTYVVDAPSPPPGTHPRKRRQFRSGTIVASRNELLHESLAQGELINLELDLHLDPPPPPPQPRPLLTCVVKTPSSPRQIHQRKQQQYRSRTIMAYCSEQLQEYMVREDWDHMELLSWSTRTAPVHLVASPQLGTEAVPLIAAPQLGTQIVPLVTIPQVVITPQLEPDWEISRLETEQLGTQHVSVVITPQLGNELSVLFTPPFIPACFGFGVLSLLGLSKLGMPKHIVHRHNYFGYALIEALAVAAVSAAHAMAADSTEVNNRIMSPRRNHPIQLDGKYGNCVS